MERNLISATWDKYMGTEIDSVTLFFADNYKKSLVDEFEVPDDEKYLFYYAMDEDGSWNWLEIVNPAELAKAQNPTLPDLRIGVNGVMYSVHDVVKSLYA